ACWASEQPRSGGNNQMYDSNEREQEEDNIQPGVHLLISSQGKHPNWAKQQSRRTEREQGSCRAPSNGGARFHSQFAIQPPHCKEQTRCSEEVHDRKPRLA